MYSYGFHSRQHGFVGVELGRRFVTGLAELLRSLQTSEDYIDELMQIREHEKALQVIHQLSDGIRDASIRLKKLLGTIKPPGV